MQAERRAEGDDGKQKAKVEFNGTSQIFTYLRKYVQQQHQHWQSWSGGKCIERFSNI